MISKIRQRLAREPRFDLSLQPEDVFQALDNERRRLVIQVLKDREPVHMSDVAEDIAFQQFGRDTGQPRKRVYVSLYQTNIPELERLGIVKYHEASKTVWRGENFEDVAQVLEAIEVEA